MTTTAPERTSESAQGRRPLSPRRARGMGRGLWLQRRLGTALGRVLLVAAVGITIVMPIYTVVSWPFKDLAAAWDAVSSIPRLSGTLVNTFVLGLGSAIAAVLIGGGFAWMSRGLSGRVANVVTAFGLAPLLIPPLAGVTGWIFLLSPAVGYLNYWLRKLPFIDGDSGPLNIYSMPAVVLVTSVYLVPFVFLFVSESLRNIDRSLEDAARISGATWIQTQRRIVLPLVRPALVFSSVIVLLIGLGQFTAPLLIGRTAGVNVLTTEIFKSITVTPIDYGKATMLAWPLVVASLVLTAVQRRVVRPVHGAASRGATRIQSPKRNLIGGAVIVTYGFVAFILPVIALGLVSLSPYWDPTIGLDDLSLHWYRDVFADPANTRAIWNTIKLSGIATLVSVGVGVLCALTMVRGRSKVARAFLDWLISLPLGVPALIFGMGVLFGLALGWPRGYGQDWVFVAAYVIITLPHTTRLCVGRLLQIGPDMEAAGRASGGSPLSVLCRITLPLMRDTLLSGALLAFLILSHEFAASTLLRTSGKQTITTQIYDYWLYTGYAPIAVLALTLIAISAVIVVALRLFGTRRSGGDVLGHAG